MINKKNLLGKTPDELGTKDAIHVAIVSVRAAKPIKHGERCGLNKDREAVPDAKGCGVADPFQSGVIATGQRFWLLMAQDEVANVKHSWEHETIDFLPPTVEMKLNSELKQQAEKFGVTYEQLMAACAYVVKKDSRAKHPGGKTEDELDEANEDLYELWSEWAEESGHEFENQGSACCPEYDYPECGLFKV